MSPVYYPKGTYLASGILIYPKQTVFGDGPAATIINQGSNDPYTQDNNSVFIVSEWENSASPNPMEGPVIRDLAIIGTPGSAGYAFINYSRQSRLERLAISNIPILLTALPYNPPKATTRPTRPRARATTA